MKIITFGSKTYTQLVQSTSVKQEDIVPGSSNTWRDFNTASLLQMAKDGNVFAADILILRYNNRIERGKKPRPGTCAAIAELGIDVPTRKAKSKEPTLTVAMAAVEPEIEAKKEVAAKLTAEPGKTVEDYIAIGEAKGIDWLANALKKAASAKLPDPTKVGGLAGAIAYLNFKANR